MKKNGIIFSRRPFFKRLTTRLAFFVLIFLLFIAVFAGMIANEKPLYVQYKNHNLFPALSLKNYADLDGERLVYSTTDWRALQKEKVIWCPVPYSPGKSDLEPSEPKAKHWLGTTTTGSDVLSGLIHGARISFTIGILSMVIAGLLGISLGAAAGFFGDSKIKVSTGGYVSGIFIGLPLSYFYGFHLNPFQAGVHTPITIAASLFYILITTILCIAVTYLSGKKIGTLLSRDRKNFLPVDQIISRSIEIFNSIPRIVLIITLSAISRPSITSLVLIIGLTSWTEIARLIRAEMLRVRESEFMQSAEASGISIGRQIFRHALPNILVPALTAITLGIAAAILTESALSFLGVGVPADVVTWGSLLNEGRQNFNAWWLVAFPGFAIFITVASLNLLGDSLAEMLDKKNSV